MLVLDVETTISNKGNAHDKLNKLVCFSYLTSTECSACPWDVQGSILCQSLIDVCSLIVGFNFKFDALWLSKSGISFQGKKVWDVQIAEFILSRQTNRFPSLNETCIKYGHPTKRDAVK